MTPRPYHYLLLAGLVAFLILAVDAAFQDTAPGDIWMTRQLQSVDSGALQNILDATEDFAAMPLLLAVVAAGAALFIYLGGMPPAIVILAALPMRLLVAALKEAFDRPRPSPNQVHVGNQPSDASFPSGHAFNAIVAYGLIFVFAAIYVPYRPLRWALQAVSVYVVAAVSLERVYDGNHWPSDVLAGLGLGAAVLGLLLWVFDWLRGRETTAAGDRA